MRLRVIKYPVPHPEVPLMTHIRNIYRIKQENKKILRRRAFLLKLSIWAALAAALFWGVWP